MAISFKQQSRIRKMVYVGLILGLLTTSWLYRKYMVEPLANKLQLRAESQGEVELTSAAVRYTLLGSRGLATTILWQIAIEKQKRHQWNQLELVVTSITKLQPNFVTPWMFQGWNLAFNVAVECDQPRDKYFYISRGIQLLAEGERRHQGALSAENRFPGNPDMRFSIGQFYQMKIGNSDEKNVMRCLFDLSCIDPLEWDPDRFADDHPAKMENLKKFCEDHPRLVRRLREKLFYADPTEMIAFLKNNRGIPARFGDKLGASGKRTELTERTKQFPILPPKAAGVPFDPDQERFESTDAPDFDYFLAANYWYLYAQEPLPPPRNKNNEPFMGVDEPNSKDQYFKTFFRLPKMTTEIFRGYPARAREYYAYNRERYEGWFGPEGWGIDRWFGKGVVVIVGSQSKYHAVPAWEKAFQDYEKYGEETGLLLSEEKKKKLEDTAQYYRKKYLVSENEYTVEPDQTQRQENGGLLGQSFDAHKKLLWNQQMGRTTNYNAHYVLCDVERLPEVVEVRLGLYQGQKKQKQQFDTQDLAKFEAALGRWVTILLEHPKFCILDEIQTETYETQWKILTKKQDHHKQTLIKVLQGLSRLGDISPLMPQPKRMVNALLLEYGHKEKKGDVEEWFIQDEEGSPIRWEGTSPLEMLKLHKPEMKVVPMRQIKGPLELIYFAEGSDAKPWLSLAHHLQFAFTPAPKFPVLTPAVLELPYVALSANTGLASSLGKEWKPLLRPDMILQARLGLRLEKSNTPPPGQMPPGMSPP